MVISGTASGIGAATLDRLIAAGANVHALDIGYDEANGPQLDDRAVTLHHCDVGARPSIDAVMGALPDRIDVLMNCAGVPNGGRFSAEEVMAINWFGLRHLTESFLARMAAGSAVVHVASTAGRAWNDRVDVHQQLIEASSFDEGMAWFADHEHLCGDGYVLSKEAVQYYTMWRAVQLLPRGIRMNSVCPGITDTMLVGDFRRGMGNDLIDHAAAVAGRFAQPEEMAPAMLFLADDESASYLTGVNLAVDGGTGAARMTGQTDPDQIWSAG